MEIDQTFWRRRRLGNWGWSKTGLTPIKGEQELSPLRIHFLKNNRLLLVSLREIPVGSHPLCPKGCVSEVLKILGCVKGVLGCASW